MGLNIIHDPQLDRDLGSDLAQSVRDAMQRGGDCRFCGSAIDDGATIRIEAFSMKDDPGMWVYARHASCAPTAPQDTGVAVITPNTWRTSLAVTEMDAAVTRTIWDRLLRRTRTKKDPVAFFFVHPGVDGSRLPTRSDGTLPDHYLEPYEDYGLVPLGTVRIGDIPSTDKFTLEIEADRLTAENTAGSPGVLSYSYDNMSHEQAQALKSVKGIFLILTTNDVEGIDSLQVVGAALKDRGNTRAAWFPTP